MSGASVQVDPRPHDRHPAPVLAKLVADAVLEHQARTGESPRALSIRVFGSGFPAKVNAIVRRAAKEPDMMIHSDTAEEILKAIGKRLAVVDVAEP
jgi:hypothetical protein